MRSVERTEHAERRQRGSVVVVVVLVVSVVTHALQHGFSTTWKRDDDDVDTVRDGKREPVSMVRDYYDYYDYYDDDYYDAEAATANEGWRFRFLVSRGSLGGRGKSACDASDD